MEPSKYSDRVTLCTYNIMFFNDIAHSNAVDLVGYIRTLPICKQQIKQVTNNIHKEIKRYTTQMKKVGRTEFFSYACDNMADNLGQDIYKLENSIKFALDKAKIKKSVLLAKIETARVLTWGACINLDMRQKDIRKEIPVSLSDIRLTSLANNIEKLSNMLYGKKPRTVDFNKDENCILAFRIIQKKLLNGHKIADAINIAAGEQELTISEK